MAVNAFKKVDTALGMYYKQMGDDSYFDAKKIGKFLAYMDDNGFDVEDIKEELYETEPEDCSYCDFDADFPFNNDPTNETEKLKEMMNIIKICYETGKPPIANKSFEELNFKVSKKNHKRAEQMYRDQCYSMLGEAGLLDGTLIKFLAAGVENNDPSFLSNLNDCHMRDQILDYFNPNYKENDKKSHTWHNNKSIKALSAKDPNTYNQLMFALTSYQHRVCPKFLLVTRKQRLVKIDDSMKDISKRIVTVCNFVANLIRDEKVLPPFQVDFAIVVRGVKADDPNDALEPAFDDDDDDDDDEEDVKADNNDGDGDEKGDHIQDIIKRLVFEKCVFKEGILKTKDDFNARNLKPIYVEFEKKLIKNKKSKENYPQNHRLCSVIDRRQSPDFETVIFFNRPNGKDKMPKSTEKVAEWHIAESRDWLIPCASKKMSSDWLPLQKSQNGKLGASSACDGEMITLSFHVEQSDQVKCYFFWNGQVFRFYPQDIINVLPEIFVLDPDNKKFIESDEIVITAQAIKVIQDSKFEQMYHSLDSNKSFPCVQKIK